MKKQVTSLKLYIFIVFCFLFPSTELACSPSPTTYRKPPPAVADNPPNLPPKPNLTNSYKKASPPLSMSSTATIASTSKRNQKSTKTPKHTEPSTTPTNLARQILNNLNIFSHKQTVVASSSSSSSGPSTAHHNSGNLGSTSSSLSNFDDRGSRRENNLPVHHQSRSRHRLDSALDLDSSSMKSSRRPSVDTISTYLSQESKGSGSRRSNTLGSVSDLLDCSIGSDDVFNMSSHQHQQQQQQQQQIAGSIVGK
jgi:hypothetical protein